MKSVTQRYLETASGLVRARCEKSAGFKKVYAGQCRSLPNLIQVSGLAQALLFVDSITKDAEPNKALLDDLACMVGFTDRVQMLRSAAGADVYEYAALTSRVQQALVVVKRLSIARGFRSKDDTE